MVTLKCFQRENKNCNDIWLLVMWLERNINSGLRSNAIHDMRTHIIIYKTAVSGFTIPIQRAYLYLFRSQSVAAQQTNAGR